LSARKLQGWRKDLGVFLKSLPKIGDDMYQIAKRSEESFKTFVTPGMLFEAFNFEYFGPIDGHRLPHLIDILENIKHLNEPVLLHVTTKKGKGYRPAEENPVYFHGCGSFQIETGNGTCSYTDIPSYTDVFGKTMIEMAAVDDRIIAVTAAMPEGTGLSEFAERYPDRFFDVGIAEQHGVTFAAGMATEGMKPVVAIYSTFLQRGFDQIIHDVCLEALPVVFAIDRGGLVGEDGPTHHGLFDLAYLRNLPNMVVMAPQDENELRRMLLTAVNHSGPIAVRYPRGQGTGVEIEKEIRPLEVGRSRVAREGTDLLILALGRCVAESLNASEILKEKGLETTVVNSRFVKPLDSHLLVNLARQHQHIITVEENVLQGGFGSAVLECLSDADVTGFRLKRIGLPDMFVEHGAPDTLRSKYGLDADGIAKTALAFIE
jgi:1-deoxy-D-xylulose-5-phosphate synthase